MSSKASPQGRAPGVGATISVRRFANEEIARVGSSLDDLDESHQFEFLCECGDLSCNQFARMTVAAYRASSPGSVVGHPVPGGVHVSAVSQPPLPDAAALAAANAHIFLHVRDADDGGQKWEFLCQCGRKDCNERVMLTIDAYIALQDHGEAVLAPGHELDPRTRSKSTREEAQALRAEARQIRRSARRRRSKA